MNYNILLLEDQESDVVSFRDNLDSYFREVEHTYKVDVARTSQEFFDKYNFDYDLVFLDIMIPDSNGIAISRKLREMDKDIGIVFLTSMSQYALEGYEVEALDFIVKPIKPSSFKLKLRRILSSIKSKNDEFIIASLKKSALRINIRDIVFIDVLGHDVTYHLSSGEKITVKGSLDKLLTTVEFHGFGRCHNSYVVNLAYVQSLSPNKIVLTDKKEIPISRSYKVKFMNDATSWFNGSL